MHGRTDYGPTLAKVSGNQSSQKLEAAPADHDEEDEARSPLMLLLLFLLLSLIHFVVVAFCCGGGCFCCGAPRFQKPTGVALVGVDARAVAAVVVGDVVPGRPNQPRPPAAGLAPGLALAPGTATSSMSAAPTTVTTTRALGIRTCCRRMAGPPPPSSSVIAASDDDDDETATGAQGCGRRRVDAAGASPDDGIWLYVWWEPWVR